MALIREGVSSRPAAPRVAEEVDLMAKKEKEKKEIKKGKEKEK